MTVRLGVVFLAIIGLFLTITLRGYGLIIYIIAYCALAIWLRPQPNRSVEKTKDQFFLFGVVGTIILSIASHVIFKYFVPIDTGLQLAQYFESLSLVNPPVAKLANVDFVLKHPLEMNVRVARYWAFNSSIIMFTIFTALWFPQIGCFLYRGHRPVKIPKYKSVPILVSCAVILHLVVWVWGDGWVAIDRLGFAHFMYAPWYYIFLVAVINILSEREED